MARMRWMVAVLVVMTASLAAAKEQAATAVKVPDDLRKRVGESEAAFNQQDARKMSAFFTANGSFTNPMGERATGRGEIETRFADDFARVLKGATGQMRIEKALMVSPTIALLDLEQEITGPNMPEGMPRPARAHVVALWQKVGGKWMIAALRPYFFLRPPSAHSGNEPSAKPSGAEPTREPATPAGAQQQR